MNAQQLALPTAPHNGTPTSRIAASMVNVSFQEGMLLRTLSVHGGMTQDEIAYTTGLLRSAVAGRCNRLEYKGLIKKDGTRLTRYGRPAAVYVLGALSAASGDPRHVSPLALNTAPRGSLPDAASAARCPAGPSGSFSLGPQKEAPAAEGSFPSAPALGRTVSDLTQDVKRWSR